MDSCLQGAERHPHAIGHQVEKFESFDSHFFPCSGVEHGNLRELALARMKDFGTECRDVRTREVA